MSLDFGSKLSTLVRSLGITQEDLAKKCQISRVTLNRYFRGKTELRSKDLLQILSVLGVDIETKIDQKLQGFKEHTSHPVYNELITLFESLDQLTKTTLLEQILWWSQLHTTQIPTTPRVNEYIKQLRAEGTR